MSTADLELHNGYLLTPGIVMPSHGIHEINVYDSIEGYRQDTPVYSAENRGEAIRWIGEKGTGTITNEVFSELLPEAVLTQRFMPERGVPLPEYITKELYPQDMLDVMVAPISEYGRVVAADTAKGYREFLEGSSFAVEDKLDEGSWGSENVGYIGSIIHLPSGKSYTVFVHVFFEQGDPTKNVVRFLNIWKEVDHGPPEIEVWEGDLDRSGGMEASSAVAEFEVTGRGI